MADIRLGATRNSWGVSAGHVDLRRSLVTSHPVTVDARPQRLTLDLARSAVVVVDMQNDFCHPEGWLASLGVDISPARRPIEPLCRILPALRAAGVPVVWLNWGNRPDLANVPPGVRHVYDPDGRGGGLGAPARPGGSPTLQAGSWSAAIVGELAPPADDLRIDKYRMSGFFDTPLDAVLRNLAVTTLLFAGVNSDQCVLATLSDAACLGYDVVLLEDCAATTSPAFCHDATVYNVAQCFGFVARSGSLVDALATDTETGSATAAPACAAPACAAPACAAPACAVTGVDAPTGGR
ncbi:cysteine hydrolase family protein [Frankia sp. AiPa1]|uniref:cysteine hydrolase family protein n=1 Tax=Frankia sp. AiPa1 TaxID=573492 RepID=UPI00202B1725|nr:isochorismatase family cysteine hydrolase [Frankia sp. AiPa1]MCL9761415.1 cysteine hydrolase [Frankia sp. AiPa1]